MEQTLSGQALGILEIVWINVILSGDNAVVIAMACRDLPAGMRRRGMVIGSGVAVALRVVFTLLIAALLTTPFVKIAGALLLLWIGAKLAGGDDEGGTEIQSSDRLWNAIRTVAIADAVMSLDNVLAIAAVARGSTFLLVLGLLISIPLIVAGAAIILAILQRLPVLVWAGAVLLGWIAGDMLVSDPFLIGRFGAARMEALHYPAALGGAAIVLLAGFAMRRRAARH